MAIKLVSDALARDPEHLARFEREYPVWSPDGAWILFDRFRPQGGDVWVMEGFER